MSEASVAGAAVSNQSQLSTTVAPDLTIGFETDDLSVNVLKVLASTDKGVFRFRSYADARKQHLEASWAGHAFRRVRGDDRQYVQPIRPAIQIGKAAGVSTSVRGCDVHIRGWKSMVAKQHCSRFASICKRARDGFFHIAGSECLQKTSMNPKPEVALKVVVRLRYIELQWEHQLLHELYQPTIPAGASDDEMKISIALDLHSILLRVAVGHLFRFLDDSFKFSEVVWRETPYAQLNRKQDQGVQKGENLGTVSIRPSAYVRPSRESPFDDSNLLKAVKSVTHGRPANLKTACQVLFTKPLIRQKLPVAYSSQNFQNYPVSKCPINRHRRKVRRIGKFAQVHTGRQYTSEIEQNPDLG
jgi:hypothetical protein